MQTLDLNKFRTKAGKTLSRVFTGRDRGAYVRDKSKIDYLFSNDGLEIIIPDEIFSITPSFLEELFKNIVLKHGKTNTLEKIKFVGKYDIQGSFEEALDRILQQKTGLEV